ncbi:MAG TPA: nucleoside-diphosphate sugar epimerase/dehydratase [Bryobacteraceae bacterium]|nr:nucleoside-diphosphate sugar epimerase/dehydratase [Bryobacteraceae bacterium]
MLSRLRTWAREARSCLCCFGIVAASFCTATLLRFEFSIPLRELPVIADGFLIAVAVKGLVFCGLRLHLDRWPRYSGFSDLVQLLRANLLASLLATIAIHAAAGAAFPRSIYCLDLLVAILFSGGVGFLARFLHELRLTQRRNGHEKGLLVYGAGVAGLELAREIRCNPKLGYRVVGFLDDDPRKENAILLGMPVLGTGADARKIVEASHHSDRPVEEIVVTMPSASGRAIRAAAEKGRAAGVPCKIVPGLGELISGKLHVGNHHEISVTDLLGREPVKLDLDHVRRAITGRAVLVTGAAGSIGTELCNQIAELAPRRLVVLDQAESEMFRLENDLRNRYPGLMLVPEIADIRDARRMEEIIEQYQVSAIFHAAAYKHVPLMERQVCEAVRNNIIGTWNLAQAAWRANVARFLMISTDKAVNPSSIMGLTKRVAELLVSASRPPVGRGSTTRYVCVRFGNVLVSNGSVVPVFQKQIAAGGPVTVTHPEMRRYFMTVQEAVQLVLEASTLGKGSEIYMLDMGQPVKIIDLAWKMIALGGLVPDEDIEIRFTGTRPGEKLFEELNLRAESLLPTEHPKIRAYQGMRVSFEQMIPWMAELEHLLWHGDAEAVIAHLAQLVPEYRPLPELAASASQATAQRAPARVASAGSYAEGAA